MKRLRQLQIANNELVDAEERIRTQVKTVQRSENLVADWMRKCWVHEENAIKSRSEVTKCRAELRDEQEDEEDAERGEREGEGEGGDCKDVRQAYRRTQAPYRKRTEARK
jgi:hypothetical protein